MKKDLAVASVTQEAAKGLLAPVRQKAALRANDRLKLLLTILQAAAGHARHPGHMPVDLSREIAAAQFDTRDDTLWLSELPTTAFLQDDAVVIPGLPRLARRLSEELGTMFQPLDAADDALLGARVRRWRDRLDAVQSDLGTASFDPAGEPALLDVLEAIGSRIVFLIDWNRARKRLLPFVGRDCAVAVLQEAARQRVGHMAWLQAGGESLIWNAMADQQPGSFRLGDRLDRVVGDGVARDFLIETLALSCRGLEHGHSVSLIADEVRALLARKMQGRRAELQLLEEHAALCHALAQGVRDALGLDMHRDFAAAERLAGRAKAWEHQADALVVNARSQAQQQPRFQPLARLVECSDDVADALEESCFVLATLAQHLEASHKGKPWPREVHEALSSLSETVLGAVQDHVKALAIAGSMDEGSDAGDHAAFLSACWQVVHAERRCDELLRAIRRSLAAAYRSNSDAVAYLLGSDFAMALEQASDALLVLSHGLRQRVLQHLQSPGG